MPPRFPRAQEAIVDAIMREEGGVADVGDGKGITRWGQTMKWLRQWHLPVPQTPADARLNYHLWLQASGLAAVCAVDDALAHNVVDWAVNSGEERAVKALQRALGVTADGVIGPKTRAKLELANRIQLGAELIAMRLDYIGDITKRNVRNREYIHGWLRRMGGLVRRLGV